VTHAAQYVNILDQRTHRLGRPGLGHRVIAKDTPDSRPSLSDFNLPGALAVNAGVSALVYGLGATATHGCWSVPTINADDWPASPACLATTWDRECGYPQWAPALTQRESPAASHVIRPMLAALTAGVAQGTVWTSEVQGWP
jgi:hypothetical protein